jgi:hypothetical protein
LYALEGALKDAPELVLASLSDLAEIGLRSMADVLPVPVGPEPQTLVGPQMPPFPPAPETELEKLHSERARLQGLLAEAVRDAHLARRERDLIRERVSEPYGCALCGTARRGHGRRSISGAGTHAWERPSDEQVKDRMLARRAARFTSHPERLATLLVARTEELLAAETRVAELEAERHSTNEALSDAAEQLRANRDRITELEALTPAAVQTCRECGAGYMYGEPCASCAFKARMAAELSAREPEGEHYATVHHTYRVGHDLPETGGDGRG